jgi:hypothetical protein
MKNAQQQQAKNLYFQTNLNKSEIAEALGINRRTVMLWVQQGNWDRLKLSSQHLPSMVVEKCYYMLNHYLDNLLSANSVISTFGPKEAAAINQLATGIKKISNRSAVNESMELLSFFLEDVRRKDPSMAEAIMPFAEQYIATRKDVNLTNFLPQNFNSEGFITESEDDIMERWLDEEEQEKMGEEAAANSEAVETAHAPAASAKHDIPNDDNNLDNLSDQDGGTPVFSTKPRFTPPTAHNLPSMTDYKTEARSHKLSKELEKQLSTFLKTYNTKAA